MQSFLHNPRLTPDQLQNPQQVLHDFFDAYSLPMAKQQWVDCVETALTTENPFYDEPLARANLLHFHKQVEELMEAAFVIKSMKKVVRKR